ncbi:MAG: hypothetical protein V7752_13140 [Halopseudomonas sp.]
MRFPSPRLPTIRHYSIGLLLLVIAGCSNVQTTVTSFHQLSPSDIGSIRIAAGNDTVQGTLEFEHHQTVLAQHLEAQGFDVRGPDADTDYVAFLSYGIDGGRTEVSSQPTSSLGIGASRGRAGYRGGVYGSVDTTTSETLYSNTIALNIVERASLATDQPKPIYEGRAKSSHRCKAITPIFDEMLTALFENFPGVSGETQTIKVKSNGDSC